MLFGLKESQAILLASPIDTETKMNRINVISFYAQNYADLVRSELNEFLTESTDDHKRVNKFVLIYILKMASQSLSLLNLLLNDCLNKSTNSELEFEMLNTKHILPYLIENDAVVISNLFNAIEQVNNGIVVYDILINLIQWLVYQTSLCAESNVEIKAVENCFVSIFFIFILK